MKEITKNQIEIAFEVSEEKAKDILDFIKELNVKITLEDYEGVKLEDFLKSLIVSNYNTLNALELARDYELLDDDNYYDIYDSIEKENEYENDDMIFNEYWEDDF